MLTALQRVRDRLDGASADDTNPDDAGITLIELLVTMGLASIVGVMALTFFVGSTKATDRTSSETARAGTARAALVELTSMLQVADTPVAGSGTGRFVAPLSATTLTFYSDRNGNRTTPAPGTTPAARTAPLKVTFTLTTATNGTQTLTESIAKPSDNYTATTTKTLIGGLTTGTGFAYCTSAPVDSTGTCTATTTPDSVASVVVTLVVKGRTGEATQTFRTAAAVSGAVQ